MSSNKNTKTSYIRPPWTWKFILCYYQACKGKLVDPRTRIAHANISKKKITRISEKSTKSYSPIDPISSLEDFMDISDEESHELHEERYSFLVKRMPVTF